MPREAGRFRALLPGLGLLAASVVVSVLLAEATLRLFDLAPTTGVSTVTEAEFDAVPGIYAPSRTVLDRSNPNLPYRVTIDSLGYRGRDLARAKPHAELRILFVGDSFVYGDFVDDEDTLPAQLERELAARCDAVRVVNAGFGGSTIVGHRAMAERGLSIEPDLVVLLFSENDVTDLGTVPMWNQLERNRTFKSRFPLNLTYPILRETALWHLLLRARAGFRAWQAAGQYETAMGNETAGEDENDPEAGRGVERVPGAPFTEHSRTELRERYREEFLLLSDTLGTHGLPLVFTAFPSHHTLLGDWPDEQIDWVHRIARDAGALSIEILDALIASGLSEQELYLLPEDGHPSPKGYQVASATLAEGLFSHGALAGHCPEVRSPGASTMMQDD